MKKEEKLNEEAALNNNLDAGTIQMNQEIAKQHKQAKNPEEANRSKQ